MKNIVFLLAVLFCVAAAGCVEDTGNYAYEDPDLFIPKVVTGFEENYDMILLQQLVLDPQVEGNEEDYEYKWYIHPTMLNVVPDTVSYERKLDYTVTQSPGAYTIVLVVTDKEHGTSSYHSTSMSVSSSFGVGYYIDKYENDGTDVDFVDRYGEVHSNILSTITGEAIPGRPINTAFASSQVGFRFQVNGEQLTSVPTFMVCTDEDLRVYNGDDMQLIKVYEDLFMELPVVKKPMGIALASVGFLLNNNDAIHMLSTSSYMGSFGYTYPGDYQVDFMTSGTTGMLAHDAKNGLFMGYTASRNTPIVSSTYSDYELIFFAAQPMQMFITYYQNAILRHKTTGNAVVASIMGPNSFSSIIYFISEVPMPPSADILNGKVFAIGGYDKSVFYYSHGDNKVNYYNYSNQVEKKSMITLPTDEKVVYIKNVYDMAFGLNNLLVLVEKNGNWKLYVHNFEGSTPDVALPARETYSGSGVPSTVIYRDPNTYVTY